MFSVCLFEPMEEAEEEEEEEEEEGLGEQRLYRFPAGEDGSDYSADEQGESVSHGSGVNMTEAGGRDV